MLDPVPLTEQVGIKLEPALRQQLEQEALKNGRRLSAEIRFRLHKSLEDEGVDLREAG